ncbi:hypothetical protein RB213_004583 [Colletotrichum asianum]
MNHAALIDGSLSAEVIVARKAYVSFGRGKCQQRQHRGDIQHPYLHGSQSRICICVCISISICIGKLPCLLPTLPPKYISSKETGNRYGSRRAVPVSHAPYAQSQAEGCGHGAVQRRRGRAKASVKRQAKAVCRGSGYGLCPPEV